MSLQETLNQQAIDMLPNLKTYLEKESTDAGYDRYRAIRCICNLDKCLDDQSNSELKATAQEIVDILRGFEAEENADLDGFVLSFYDKVAHTQWNVETNRLHADFGERILERCTEYDSNLTDQENERVDAFVKFVNRSYN